MSLRRYKSAVEANRAIYFPKSHRLASSLMYRLWIMRCVIYLQVLYLLDINWPIPFFLIIGSKRASWTTAGRGFRPISDNWATNSVERSSQKKIVCVLFEFFILALSNTFWNSAQSVFLLFYLFDCWRFSCFVYFAFTHHILSDLNINKRSMCFHEHNVLIYFTYLFHFAVR